MKVTLAGWQGWVAGASGEQEGLTELLQTLHGRDDDVHAFTGVAQPRGDEQHHRRFLGNTQRTAGLAAIQGAIVRQRQAVGNDHDLETT